MRSRSGSLSVQLWSAKVHYCLSHLDWASILPKVFSSKRTEEDRKWEVKIKKVIVPSYALSLPSSCSLFTHVCMSLSRHMTLHTHAHTHTHTHAHTHTHTHTKF